MAAYRKSNKDGLLAQALEKFQHLPEAEARKQAQIAASVALRSTDFQTFWVMPGKETGLRSDPVVLEKQPTPTVPADRVNDALGSRSSVKPSYLGDNK